jgi:hypothetical protein
VHHRVSQVVQVAILKFAGALDAQYVGSEGADVTSQATSIIAIQAL